MEMVLYKVLRILAAAAAIALGTVSATGGMTEQSLERPAPTRFDKAESTLSGENPDIYRVTRQFVASSVSKYWMVVNGAAQPGVVRPS